MLKEEIISELKKALVELGLTEIEPSLTQPTETSHGDYSSNIALVAAKKLKTNPMELAQKITEAFNSQLLNYLDRLEAVPPGFINFWLSKEYLQKQVGEILKTGKMYGSSKVGVGKKARVEFVSANPTGPLHFGNARGGPIGDVLAAVLSFSGYKVLREYLHNDIGGQVERLGEGIFNFIKGESLEEQEYKGEYIKELAQKIGQVGDAAEAGKKAVKILLSEIISDCRKMGISFERVYKESEFVETGQTEKVLTLLKTKGFLREQEGAIWFAPKDEFLKDRECVVVKSDGSYTYFANDIAYHQIKFSEAYDLIIDIFGANHSGHVPRLQAAIAALGFDVSKFQVILYQWVRFKKSSEIIKMSKRSGTFVTAREVLGEVGAPAVRFFILMHEPNSHLDFDLELAKKKSQDNPVYYVQYAHARISSILKKAKVGGSPDLALLDEPEEIALIKHLIKFPELVEGIAKDYGVHHLTRYAISLADLFHRFYEECRVISDDKVLTVARLALVRATQTVLQNTLYLLGIAAPERM